MSGILQIILGGILIVVSFIINFRAKNSKFTLFIYVGAIFLAYGLLKFIYHKITSPKEKKERKQKKHVVEQPHSKYQTINPHEIKQFKNHNSPMDNHHPSIIACHSCNTKHYNTANFCQMCGTRIK